MSRSVAAVVAVMLTAIAVGIGAILLDREPRLAGSGTANTAGIIADVQPGAELCQRVGLVPAGTAQLRVFVGTAGAPVARLRAQLRRDGAVVASSPIGPHREGVTRFALRPVVARELTGVRVCIINAGAGMVQLAGVGAADGGSPGTIAFSWYGAGERSGASLIGAVVERAGVARGGGGAAWFVVAVILLLGAGVGALVWTARGART